MSRRTFFFSALALTVFDVFPSDAFASLDTASDGKKYALLIGIDEYEDKDNLNPLEAAAADARKLAQALKDVAGFGSEPGMVRLLVSDATDTKNRPTRNNVVEALDALARQAKPGDTVFVLYSGHGIEIDGTSYLLPYDARGTSDETLSDTGLTVARFRSRLEKVQARMLFLAFDMCRTNPRKNKAGDRPTLSGDTIAQGKLESRGVAGAQTPYAEKAAPPARTVATLFSCDRDQSSWEWATLGRGYFSYFLEQGLRGGAAEKDGTVRLGNLLEYVARETEAAVKRDKGGALQRPYSDLHGPGDAARLVLAANVAPLVNGASGGAAALVATLVPELIDKAKSLSHYANTSGKSQALYAVVQVLLQLGDNTGAVETAQTIPLTRVKTEAILAIAEKQADIGNLFGARQAILQAYELSRKDVIWEEKASLLRQIAEVQAKLGDATGAKQSLAQAAQSVYVVKATQDVFAAQRKASVLSDIACDQVRVGDIGEAKKTSQAIDKSFPWLQDQVIGAIAVVQSETGDITSAKQTLSLADDAGSKVSISSKIAATQAKLGNASGARQTFIEAVQIARSVTYPNGRVRLLTIVANAQAKVGYITEAKQTVIEAAQVEKSVSESSTKDIYEKALDLCDIAVAHMKAGNTSEARQTFIQAVQNAARAQNEDPAIDTPAELPTILPSIAVAQARSGDIKAAKQTLQMLKANRFPDDAQSTIAQLQIAAGDIDGAKQTAQEIRDTAFKAIALGKIAEAIAESGKYAEALKLVESIESSPHNQSVTYCNIAVFIIERTRKK